MKKYQVIVYEKNTASRSETRWNSVIFYWIEMYFLERMHENRMFLSIQSELVDNNRQILIRVSDSW